jgi:hypothetical protein
MFPAMLQKNVKPLQKSDKSVKKWVFVVPINDFYHSLLAIWDTSSVFVLRFLDLCLHIHSPRPSISWVIGGSNPNFGKSECRIPALYEQIEQP